MIHSTAVVQPGAEISPDAEIGPYAVIGAHVKIGPETRLLAQRTSMLVKQLRRFSERQLRCGEQQHAPIERINRLRS